MTATNREAAIQWIRQDTSPNANPAQMEMLLGLVEKRFETEWEFESDEDGGTYYLIAGDTHVLTVHPEWYELENMAFWQNVWACA